MRPSRKRDEEEIHQVQSWGWNSWKNYSYEWKSSYYSNGWRKVRRYQESSVCNEASKETCGRCLRQEEQSDSSSKLHAAVAVQTRTWKLRKSRYQPNVRWIGSAKRRMRPSCYKLHDHFHATGRFLRNFSIRVISTASKSTPRHQKRKVHAASQADFCIHVHVYSVVLHKFTTETFWKQLLAFQRCPWCLPFNKNAFWFLGSIQSSTARCVRMSWWIFRG